MSPSYILFGYIYTCEFHFIDSICRVSKAIQKLVYYKCQASYIHSVFNFHSLRISVRHVLTIKVGNLYDVSFVNYQLQIYNKVLGSFKDDMYTVDQSSDGRVISYILKPEALASKLYQLSPTEVCKYIMYLHKISIVFECFHDLVYITSSCYVCTSEIAPSTGQKMSIE